MPPQLKVVPPSDYEAADAPVPARFDLGVQATRPGLAYEPICITANEATVASVAQVSARDGLPPEAWAALAIESSRSLTLASRLVGIPEDCLATEHDAAARVPESRRVPAGPGGRLIAYARCLRAAPQCTVEAARVPFIVPVPYVAVIAWQHAAAESRAKVGEWAARTLATLPVGRVAWEAAAAEAGQTLCEWVLSQAASCPSRSSTLAHSAG
jgi:hypothetical protein